MEFKVRKKTESEIREKAQLGKTHDVIRPPLTGLDATADNVGDRYNVEGIAGRGGMGIVQAVHDTVLDRILALKVMYQDKASDPKERSFY